MTIEKVKEVRETISKIKSVLQVDIIYELDSQLSYKDYELSDDDYCKLYEEIEYAYLKVENVDIGAIVECALDNKDKILNDDENFSLREECCWY